MRRDELAELNYITPMTNVPSILARGLLSHNRVAALTHSSVAMAEIQDLRRPKRVPGARLLHDYVNLYICARNPMMYVRHEQHESLCVLRISTDVLDLPGVVVSDCNAATGRALFKPAPAGLSMVDRARVFAEYWTHQDEMEQIRHKADMCAEVLVPDRVAPDMIMGAYVSGLTARQALLAVAPGIDVASNSRLFFR